MVTEFITKDDKLIGECYSGDSLEIGTTVVFRDKSYIVKACTCIFERPVEHLGDPQWENTYRCEKKIYKCIEKK